MLAAGTRICLAPRMVHAKAVVLRNIAAGSGAHDISNMIGAKALPLR
jgi:hypothetical protein